MRLFLSFEAVNCVCTRRGDHIEARPTPQQNAVSWKWSCGELHALYWTASSAIHMTRRTRNHITTNQHGAFAVREYKEHECAQYQSKRRCDWCAEMPPPVLAIMRRAPGWSYAGFVHCNASRHFSASMPMCKWCAPEFSLSTFYWYGHYIIYNWHRDSAFRDDATQTRVRK